jgi:hypothetical protein
MTAEIDSSGRYVLAKHAVVTFCMEGFPVDKSGISNTRIEFFNCQNVLSNACVNRLPEGYELLLEGCYGVDGSIVCERMKAGDSISRWPLFGVSTPGDAGVCGWTVVTQFPAGELLGAPRREAHEKIVDCRQSDDMRTSQSRGG